MRKATVGLALWAAILSQGGCKPRVQPAPPVVPVKAEPVWAEFTSKEGRFAITMPGTPKEEKVPVKTTAGDLMATVNVVGRGDSAWGVIYGDLGPNQEMDLDKAIEGMAASLNGVVLHKKNHELAGKHAGREFEIVIRQGRGGYCYGRVFTVGRRHYQIQVIKMDANWNSADTEKLFNSFRVLE